MKSLIGVGVMALLLTTQLWAAEMVASVEVRGRINDHALIIGKSERHRLYQMLAQHQFATKRGLVLVTAETSGAQPAEQAAESIWQGWQGKRKTSSAMLVVFKKERTATIVAGNEVQQQLNNKAIESILTGEVKKQLTAGEFERAIGTAAEAIILRLKP